MESFLFLVFIFRIEHSSLQSCLAGFWREGGKDDDDIRKEWVVRPVVRQNKMWNRRRCEEEEGRLKKIKRGSKRCCFTPTTYYACKSLTIRVSYFSYDDSLTVIQYTYVSSNHVQRSLTAIVMFSLRWRFYNSSSRV